MSMSGRLGLLAGHVMDADGRPVPEARVFVVAGPSHPDIAAFTGEDGRFALGSLAPGLYRLQVEAGGFAARPLTVEVRPALRAVVKVVLPRLPDWPEAEEIPGGP